MHLRAQRLQHESHLYRLKDEFCTCKQIRQQGLPPTRRHAVTADAAASAPGPTAWSNMMHLKFDQRALTLPQQHLQERQRHSTDQLLLVHLDQQPGQT